MASTSARGTVGPPRRTGVDKRDVDDVYRSLGQTARYLQIVNELALALLRTSTMDEILWLVAKSAVAQLGFEDCVIYLVDDTGELLVQRAAHGPKNPADHDILDPIAIPLGQGIVGTVAATGLSALISDTREDPRYILDDQMRLSEIAVPILHEGRVIGVIDSEHPDPGFYTADHQEVLTTIASIASTRIATALTLERLHDTVARLEGAESELRDSEQRYRALYNSHPSMFFTLNAEGIIRSVNQFAAERLGYTVEYLVGRPVTDLHRDGDATAIAERLTQCLRDPDSLPRWESCLETRGGEPVWVRETARAVSLPGGDHEVLVVSEDISDVHKLAQELRYHASHDVLTGLRNRREFENHLREALSVAQTEQVEHALLFMDLDMFKVVNDACGHVAGDELLRQVSKLFQLNVRRSDLVARVGGDEFAVLMPYCSLEDALGVAEKLRLAVQEYRLVWGDRTFSVGVSIGIKRVDRSAGTIGELLSMADTACYMAKERGRNCIQVYSEDDQAVVHRGQEVHWIKRMQDALDTHRFQLLRQTIEPIRADTGKHRVHFECLLRLVDDDSGYIAPASFLPAAERYGLSLRVDRYVISRVFEWMAQQPCETGFPLLCGINLSGLSLNDEFLAFLRAELHRTGVAPQSVCLEITETAAVANFASAGHFIQELRGLGCCFALDDFGSGLSSFTYLKHLPVDFLKIDGSFIRSMLSDPVSLELVTAMNDIAHRLGMSTIAESVESQAVLTRLGEIGVDYAQGYFIGMPEPIAETTTPLPAKVTSR